MNIARIITLAKAQQSKFNADRARLSALFYWVVFKILTVGMMSWTSVEASTAHTVIAGMIALELMLCVAMEVSWCTVRELFTKNFVNLFSSPITIYEWMASVALMAIYPHVLVLSFSSALVYGLFGFNFFLLGWKILPLLLNYYLMGVSLGFVSSGLLMRYGTSMITYVFMISFAFLPLSGVYYDIAIFPLVVQKFAYCLPLYYSINVLKELVLYSTFNIKELFIAFGLNVFYLVLAIRFFAYMFNQSRKIGLSRVER